jgi:fructokinase
MAEHSIIGLGELLWDYFGDTRRPGGAPANVAFHASQLGARGQVCSRVGCDEPGDDLLRELGRHGVETGLIQRDASHPTGTVAVDDSRPNHPTYTIHDEVAWDYIQFDQKLQKAAGRAAAVCFGTLAQRSPQSRETIRRTLAAAPNALLVCDLNLRPPWYDRATIESSLDSCAVLKLNEDEARHLADLFDLGTSDAVDCAGRLVSRFGLALVCLTRGSNGCVLVTRQQRVERPGRRVEVVDAVGSGDAFTAALVCALLWEWPLDAVAEFANEVGALVATRQGAMPALAIEYRALRARAHG